MLGAGMVKFYVPIYMFMMNHSGIVSVIKKKCTRFSRRRYTLKHQIGVCGQKTLGTNNTAKSKY